MLKREVEALPIDQLPLQQGLTYGSHVADDKHSALVISVAETAEVIRAKIGVFFSGMLAGCSCADDPTPVEAVNEYCELWLEMDKKTGETSISIAD